MIRVHWGRVTMPGLVMTIALSGCTALIPQPTPTPEPVMADCFIYYHLTAWEDLNADGVQDDGEEPLEGVEFIVKGPYSILSGGGITDGSGRASFDLWGPGGCPEDVEIKIDAVPPSGFAPSTDLPLSVEGVSGSYDYAVGFYPEAAE